MAFLADQALGYLRRSYEQNRLAHAYLITGRQGAGKERLARDLVALCNGVHAERLEAIRDPNFHLIRPESRSRRIKIDQVRALERQLHLSGAPGKTKIGVIREADRLQTESENAFLKTLEEPPPGTLLLLLTAQPEQLLDTIRSRCLGVPLYAPGNYQPAFSGSFENFLQAAAGILSASHCSLSRALVLAGTFAKILKEEKEAIAKENDAALKEEMDRYAETTDGDWLRRREAFYKDRTESEYVRRRTTMLEGVLAFLGDAVRLQAGYERLDFACYASLSRAVAQRLSPSSLNHRFAALEALRDHLETNVQDALAIEVGFIKAFA